MKTKLTEQLGKSIAEYRKLSGMTQQEVALEINLEVETVSRIETGDMSTTVKRLDQFAKLFNCPVSSFFPRFNENSDEILMTFSDLIRPLKTNEKKAILEVVSVLALNFKKSRK